MDQRWTEADMTDQAGRTVVVTGANSGLGLRTAEVLAGRGARVLLACRSAERGAAALDRVRSVASGAAPELVTLDLADLASVRAAAASVRELTGDALDVLINNAGVVATARGKTADGFELQLGTNHLGHAALTWLLMPALRGGVGARVVTLSSIAAIGAQIRLDDPNFEHRQYNPATAYRQAKLANQVFALELDRRLRAEGSKVLSVLAHPGYTATGLSIGMARTYGNRVVRSAILAIHHAGEFLLSQNVSLGALPELYAATAPDIQGGDYIGPRGLGGVHGYPTKVRPVQAAGNPVTGPALWDLTADLTGVTPDPR
ncbi:oxidoreductase [Amycolatopsis saalfeldensis]|uniref:NAD(P)-dependent dehydrogenase, short-chain alcohol dehydrogenase family n=1 Tax=Amycolatopsis saalfeldensis TaxID=394193 RepID=A0A1H8YPU8_9PSEU|nr:oxidoreductase [Amycolatopsis saalfeldensis]SEP54206.1 NAD(P)-dependent dehydrogenase, short-chain alcohol dehydrogenase family [Amycolatopsis saalfeldensis]